MHSLGKPRTLKPNHLVVCYLTPSVEAWINSRVLIGLPLRSLERAPPKSHSNNYGFQINYAGHADFCVHRRRNPGDEDLVSLSYRSHMRLKANGSPTLLIQSGALQFFAFLQALGFTV